MEPNNAFVTVDPTTGTLRRYLARRRLLLTHEATREEPTSFTPEMVEDFRTKPPIRFHVMPPDSGPPPPPTNGSPMLLKVA